MNPDGFCSNQPYALSRRQMLKGVSCGFGMLAFLRHRAGDGGQDEVRTPACAA